MPTSSASTSQALTGHHTRRQDLHMSLGAYEQNRAGQAAFGGPSLPDIPLGAPRGRSRSPNGSHHHLSHKGTVKIHIPSFVILVHPPEPTLPFAESQPSVPRDDTVMDGSIEVIMKEPRIAKSIKVSLVAFARLQYPGDQEWQEKIIFERSVEIGGSNSPEGIKLEKGSQSFAFTLILPATICTYDKHPTARINHTLKAVVDGVPYQSSTPFSIFSSKGKGKQRDHSKQRDRSRQPSRSGTGNNTPRTASPSPAPSRRTSLLPSYSPAPPSTDASPLGPPPAITAGSYFPGAQQNPPLHSPDDENALLGFGTDIKPLKGQMQAERHLIVFANPQPESNGVMSLDMQKVGKLPGVGDWRVAIRSEAFSVGSYISLSVRFIQPSSSCTIYATRLLLTQNYTLASLNDPNAPRLPGPKRTFIIATEGHIPQEKRPTKDTMCLWRGPDVGKGKLPDGQKAFTEDVKVRTGLKRLPDDTRARPSTCQGTDSPCRVTHEFVLQVFFSVEGEDLQGQPLALDEDPNTAGVMRMMILTMPVLLPSCCCTFERIVLPEYSATPEAVDNKVMAICACGYSLDHLAARERAHRQQEAAEAALQGGENGGDLSDEVDRIDMDMLNLDERGRERRREADRRKMEYSRTVETVDFDGEAGPSGSRSVSRGRTPTGSTSRSRSRAGSRF